MGDTSKHLTYFKVENFKRFESFEMKDLGQFNLIVGDNNTGKTSVLEALLINEDLHQTIYDLLKALEYRNLISEFLYNDLQLYKNVKSDKSKNSISVEYRLRGNDERGLIDLSFDMSRQMLVLRLKHDSAQPSKSEANLYTKSTFPYFYASFIPFYQGHDEDLTRFYSRLQEDRSLKNNFIKNLKVIVPELENIEPTHQFEKPHLIVYQNHINQTIPLAFFGDGVLKLFRILAAININKGRRLMVDEVDTGIHFSRFKEFWKTVLLAAKENDVQLFMTTHNKECIKYFKEVLEDELPNLRTEARSITLIENPKKEIKAFTYTFDQLQASVEFGNEVRGGAR